MKKLHYYLFSLLFVLTFSACGGGDEGSANAGETSGATPTEESGDAATDAAPVANTALSTWEGHSLKTEAGGGKWLASVSFGEEMELMGETQTNEKDKREYEQVRLLDGKEGWIRGDLIAKGGKLAAIKVDAQIYKRPSISNISDNAVKMGELVVITQEKDEFSEFVSRNNSANKRQKGWLLGSKSLTANETDIAAAVMLGKAMAEKNPIKRKEKLEQMQENEMFSGSVFMAQVEAMLTEADAGANLAEDQLMVTGDNVNVRSGPTIAEENKVFQVGSGDICQIVQRGDMDEIGGQRDFWYKISIDGQEGWIFGTFTSKAQ
ncbi:MAG: SH3 domain-containing protein [Bacteroidota bacterium]